MLKVKDNVDLKELEKFGFKYTTDDIWCGFDEECPKYERRALIDEDGHSWGTCIVDIETREIYYDVEWWYDWFEYYDEREMEPLIKAGLVEKVE